MQKLRSNAVRRVTMVFLDAVAGTDVQIGVAKMREGKRGDIPEGFAGTRTLKPGHALPDSFPRLCRLRRCGG